MMTPEELDEARAKEAERIWDIENSQAGTLQELATIAARLARENWTPPKPVDPDILAWREWFAGRVIASSRKAKILAGEDDHEFAAKAYLAGARMAREQERELAKELVDYVWEDVGAPGGDEAKARSNRAFDIITKYEKGGQ